MNELSAITGAEVYFFAQYNDKKVGYEAKDGMLPRNNAIHLSKCFRPSHFDEAKLKRLRDKALREKPMRSPPSQSAYSIPSPPDSICNIALLITFSLEELDKPLRTPPPTTPPILSGPLTNSNIKRCIAILCKDFFSSSG